MAGTVMVRIPGRLLARTGNRGSIAVSGGTVREVIAALDEACPGLAFNICEETGELRQFVNVFVGGEEIRYLQGLDTPVEPNSTMFILHSVAGG